MLGIAGKDQVMLKVRIVEMDRNIIDRKSTRLNSSHRCISYAVFCLKKTVLSVSNGKHPMATPILRDVYFTRFQSPCRCQWMFIKGSGDPKLIIFSPHRPPPP